MPLPVIQLPALKGNEFDSKKITGWHEKLQFALDRGFDGLRISGNAFWIERTSFMNTNKNLSSRWKIGLCLSCALIRSVQAAWSIYTRPCASPSVQCRRRQGRWEFLETPELKQAKREIKSLGEALLVLSRPFAAHKLLTARERTALAQIVRGASSKEAAAWLKVSPRTIEFHRANIMQKLGAKM
jgi:DNA-binding CsgD family transcriptional regulator